MEAITTRVAAQKGDTIFCIIIQNKLFIHETDKVCLKRNGDKHFTPGKTLQLATQAEPTDSLRNSQYSRNWQPLLQCDTEK